ncbi:hypothetical protein VTN96DRAFT_2527 [Rasamsonia emersonii]
MSTLRQFLASSLNAWFIYISRASTDSIHHGQDTLSSPSSPPSPSRANNRPEHSQPGEFDSAFRYPLGSCRGQTDRSAID